MLDRTLRPALPVLALAALLLPSPALASSSEADTLLPGSVGLELSSSLPSRLSIDRHLLSEIVCAQDPGDIQGGAGEVGLTVSNDGPPKPPPFIIQILDAQAQSEGIDATVSTTRLAWSGPTPLVTDCGSWDYTVTLDADAEQPTSTFRLARATSSQPTAPISGTLAVAAVLRFTSADGEVRSLSLPLTFEITGRYTLAQADDGTLPAPLGAGDSNLVLFVEQTAAGWAALPAIVSGSCGNGLCPGGHRLVLQASSRSAEALRATD